MGILNNSQFKYTSLDPPGSKNIPPLSINVQLSLFGTQMNITLNQLEGTSSNSSITNTNVYTVFGANTTLNKMNTQEMVR